MNAIPLTVSDEEGDYWISPSNLPTPFPTTTVIIPSYNAEATLERAIECVRCQTQKDIEILVVDDASTDSSWSAIDRGLSAEPRLRAIRNKKNMGKAAGMNRAISNARGRWLAVLDSDDFYDADRIAALVRIGEARGVDLVADNQFLYDAVADKVVSTAWASSPADWTLTFDEFLAGSDAYETFNLGMLKPVIRADSVRRMALTYDEHARHGQDFFYLLQFYLGGGTAAVSDVPYYYYTQPFGALSRQWSHAARRRYDFETAYRINQRYLEIAAAALTPWEAAWLRARNERLRSLEYFYQVKECVARRDLGGAVRRLAGHPEIMRYVFRRLFNLYSGRRPSAAIEAVAARARRAESERRSAPSVPR